MFAKKIATAALVAATLVTVAATASPALAGPHHHHHHGHGWGWGAAGLATGLVIGSTLASSGPAYAAPVYDAPMRRCFWVERVNRWGEIVNRRVCRYE